MKRAYVHLKGNEKRGGKKWIEMEKMTFEQSVHVRASLIKGSIFKRLTPWQLIAVLPLKFQCNFWFLPLLLIFQLSRF